MVIVVRIRGAVAAVVAGAHNVWAQLPVGIQGTLLVIVAAASTYVAAYNWVLPAGVTLDPATWHLLVTTGAAFVLGLWAFLYPIIAKQLWPQVIPWLLKLLQLVIATQPVALVVKNAYGSTVYRTVNLWQPA